MSGKGPTDFNDQAAAQGAQQVAEQIASDLAALQAVRQEENIRPAQLLEGEPQGGEVTSELPPPDSPPPNAARHDNDWRDLMEVNKEGNYKASVSNVALVLQYDEQWRDCLAYSDLSYKIIKRTSPPMPNCDAGEWREEDSAALRIWMARQFGFTPGHGDIQDAVITVARGNRFHPIREYLLSLKWDGVSRLPTWLKRAFGATDPEKYLETIGPRFMIGAVARVMRPGCQMDNVMILEGTQGAGKSTIIGLLFGDWFSDTLLPIGDKEAYQLIQGVWGFELGELDSFNKAEITELKRFFSQKTDRYRPSYGRYVEDFQRQTVFIGSTNQEVYLRDYTGNRRYWPLYCAALDRAWVEQYRDQLWAEAMHRFKTGEKWWVSQETPEEWDIVCEAQDSRLQRDPWEDLLFPFLRDTARARLSSADVLTEGIGLDGAHIQQAHMNRIAPLMKTLGWVSTRQRVDAGGGKQTQRRVWMRAEDKKKLEEVTL